MIHRCWFCGHRINQRNPGEPDNPRIGKHALFEGKPFHDNDDCIPNWKLKPKKKRDAMMFAPIWDGNEPEWKIARKQGKIEQDDAKYAWYNKTWDYEYKSIKTGERAKIDKMREMLFKKKPAKNNAF